MNAIEAAIQLSTVMAMTIQKFRHSQFQQGNEPTKPKYIFLGDVEQDAWRSMVQQNPPYHEESYPDRSPKRTFMGVEVIFVRDKDSFLAVGL